MNKHHSFGAKVGILGGGQLARMLALSAHALGLEPIVFCLNENEPAAQAVSKKVLGAISDEAALKTFFQNVDVVIFENEHVDCNQVRNAAKDLAVTFVPELNVLEKLQDKLAQKQILKKLGVPTSPFVSYMPDIDRSLENWVEKTAKQFAGHCVFKWARMGYDGHGVHTLRKEKPDFDSAVRFCKAGIEKGAEVYAEAFVRFRRELALVQVHSLKGIVRSYPLVVTEQKDGICFSVAGPAVALGVHPDLEQSARTIAEKVAKELGLRGVFAIEFFEAETGGLIVNEIAPRVHNSGHFTQDAAVTSQFENHCRAVLGMELGSPECDPGFAMYNLLGPDTPVAHMVVPAISDRLHLHWYGKTEMRPRRKLGHINGRVGKASELPSLLQEMRTLIENWSHLI